MSQEQKLYFFNTLTKQKELFEPLNPPFVGMYVCGPTVYNDAHLGNARPAVVFDVLYRLLQHMGYKVRYVRNITDVGHLTDDSDHGEDKIAQRAKLEQLEPMEVVQRYTVKYHRVMDWLNVLRPSIEPTATGHILEQIEVVQRIIDKGWAYEVNGSVYFDVPKYAQSYPYGELSGRDPEEQLANSRDNLEGQEEKRHPADFALWKKANPEHIMRWNSPWGAGFPGWHLECTVMSTKYLGETFDIHGGGMDLVFPHHECEIAQAKAANNGKSPVRYWLHNNLITIEGKKMSKSLGNFITLEELFSGNSPLISQPYTPMTVRLFLLLAHYRSTLDFSDQALQAARKVYIKLLNAIRDLKQMRYPEVAKERNEKLEKEITQELNKAWAALYDDLNTALCLTHLQALVKKVNQFRTKADAIGEVAPEVFARLQTEMPLLWENILGMKEERPEAFEPLLNIILKHYAEAKAQKQYDKVDAIRADLKTLGIVVRDGKQGIDWAYEE
jgi:cysteinyl-tRNA synthetase